MPATDKFAYNLKKLHVVFALSCFGIFVATFWMMASDHRDEWREYQIIGFNIEAAKAEIAKLGLETDAFTADLEQLAIAREEAEKAFEDGAESRVELEEQRALLAQDVDILTRRIKVERAFRDVSRANYDLGIAKGYEASELKALKATFDTKQRTVENTQTEFETADTAFAVIDTQFKSARAALDAAVVAEKAATADRDRIAGVLAKIAPTTGLSALKRPFMEWPIIDGFNSHLKITQDWMPGLSQTLGMTEIARFDRCRTCHMMIDRTEAGNIAAFPAGHPESDDVKDWVANNEYPQPYSTHPNHELYTTSTSPHPVAEFGCTICHDGQGSGTSFGNAEHTPNNPYMADEWQHEYGYHANHFWEYPMHPQRFIESGCIKCHHSVTELGVNRKWGASAPKVYEGYSLLQQYGCFGCHEIHGFDGGKSIGPDIRLEPQSTEEAEKVANDPTQIAGKMRKVGPSLRHVADKTTKDFLAFWTEEPKRFRPTTRMPQFFDLSNQTDPHAIDFEPAELEGIAQYLMDNSEANTLLKPVEGYKPDVARGRNAFAERGCLACHTHEDFSKASKRNAELIAGWEAASFGPDLSRIHEKVNRNSDGTFSDWLYTWVRNPELHHPRTRMPNLYLEAENGIDPAADITAYLLSNGEAGAFATASVSEDSLRELVGIYLSKALSGDAVTQTIGKKTDGVWVIEPSKIYGGKDSEIAADQIKSDEIELFTADGSVPDDATWQQMQLNYVGRRTISRYGCYGCHEIPGFEKARPIGAALQDWGRKDTSKLAFEHIHEWLHHHGEPDGGSTYNRVEATIEGALAGGVEEGYFDGDKEVEEQEMSAAFFYKSATSHGRPGFIWQKLRQPRSYDYEKVETKGYDERLRMPKFPFNEQQIEAIATFVLGLIAEPPADNYQYRPTGSEKDIIEGEKLIKKYNCTGCHILELPEVRYGVEAASITSDLNDKGELRSKADHPAALALLNHLKPPREGWTGERGDFEIDEEPMNVPVLSVRGLRVGFPDSDEDLVDQIHSFDLWENLKIGDKQWLPGHRVVVPVTSLQEIIPARGGEFAQSLVEHLKKTRTDNNASLAWQMAPPLLYKEGIKAQTPWLYNFLLEPTPIRHTTVLRMPRFNLSKEEAQTLANYFAAVDEAPYPYQDKTPADPDYIHARTETVADLLDGQDYLETSWKALNGPLCIKCHSVGGRTFKATDPKKDIQGPNLQRVQDRLRADWVKLWLYKPNWITPYTSMPVNFPKDKPQFDELFKKDADSQVIGIRDALMNYDRLMENHGRVIYEPAKAPAAAAADGAGVQE